MPQNDLDTGAFVTLANAQTWAAAWINSGGAPINPDPKAYFYGKNKIQDLLNQPGCIGIRSYHGLSNGSRVLILVGVDSNNNDMLGPNDRILETGNPCPPYCAPNTAIH